MNARKYCWRELGEFFGFAGVILRQHCIDKLNANVDVLAQHNLDFFYAKFLKLSDAEVRREDILRVILDDDFVDRHPFMKHMERALIAEAVTGHKVTGEVALLEALEHSSVPLKSS